MIDDYEKYPVEISYLLTYDGYKSLMRDFNRAFFLHTYPSFAFWYIVILNTLIDLAYIRLSPNVILSIQKIIPFDSAKFIEGLVDNFMITVTSLIPFSAIAIFVCASLLHNRKKAYRDYYYDSDTAHVNIQIDKIAIDVHVNDDKLEHVENFDQFVLLNTEEYFVIIPEGRDTQIIAIPKSKCPKDFKDYLTAKTAKSATARNLLTKLNG